MSKFHRHSFWLVINRTVCAYGLVLPACPIASSITGAPCLLPDGHPCDNPNRYHRYSKVGRA